ncbi:tripartite tricarboxylate transporter permease [Pontivivens ytuae]|uniref:Tripartite tricarboxylate transporter permease n=1 Tax=Pontivivens ytuae TaxID=2789856 RepID=A0A7S9LSR5_9RHOB|nr:tripartite tricarboxylate transporter permease [Pontivivens ytuae]QPH54624.1 tripartite tricarboxylate transporter permease [Pontivivens ytuae]
MDILDGFATLFANPTALGFVALAAFIGVVIGALPGLTAAAAIAMLVPLTFYLDPLAALAFLYVIGKSGRYGGSVAAILFNTPGTTASVATMTDGYPMAKRGESVRALRMATVASVSGDLIGDIILIFGAALIATQTAKFGPPEYFAVYMMAFLVIGSVVGASVIKGLLATVLGIAVALVGLDPITGQARWTFGVLELENGFTLVPLLIGVFVISELMVQAEARLTGQQARVIDRASGAGAALRWLDVRPLVGVITRSALYGAVIGIMPGLGSSVAAFVAYGEEKRRAPDGHEWGTGKLAGVAAPEAANNAVSGPSMIPLLTLGVPGTTVAAILMGVFLIHGIPIGPTLFVAAHDLVYGLFAAGLIGIVLYGLIGWFFGPAIGRAIAAVPAGLVYPAIFMITLIAAYTGRLSLWDVQVMLGAGVLGYAMRRLGFPPAAFIIAFILAPGAEEALRQSLLLSRTGWTIFITEPVAAAFLTVGVGVALWRSLRPSLRTTP